MKHNKKYKILSRTTKHRIALSKNLSQSLLLHGSIKTTKAKSHAAIILVNHTINHCKKKLDSYTKVQYIKQHIVNHNYQNVKQILANINNIETNKNGNYIKRIPLFNQRTDGANLVRLTLLSNTKSNIL